MLKIDSRFSAVLDLIVVFCLLTSGTFLVASGADTTSSGLQKEKIMSKALPRIIENGWKSSPL